MSIDAQQVRHIVRQMLCRLLEELADELEEQEQTEPGTHQVVEALRRQNAKM